MTDGGVSSESATASAPDHDGRTHDVEDLHELAAIERLLRLDSRAHEPAVRIGRNGARIGFSTSSLNEHARGSLTASLVNEISHTDAWGLSTVHDPFEAEEGVTESLFTVVHDAEESDR